PRLLGEPEKESHRFVGDAVLGVVEVEAGGLDRHALAALGILGEELAHVYLRDLLVVGRERLPRRGAHATAPVCSALDFDAMTPMSSSHDLTNVRAPSSCSCAASAATSTPAAANLAIVSSAFPPSPVRIGPSESWLASAFSVASGMVFTVNGAT